MILNLGFDSKFIRLCAKNNRRHSKRAKKYSGVSGIDGTVDSSVLALFYGSNSCRYCGKKSKNARYSIDHLTPLSRGGKHSISNIVLACTKCNRSKADFTLVEFIINNIQNRVE